MNEELEKKLIDDLEKAGFGSEMRAIKTFLSNQWNCTGFANYYDLDHGQTRQIDLHAFKVKWAELSSDITAGVEFFIDAEVKKSEKPWIVFKEYVDDVWFIEAWGNLAKAYNLGSDVHMLVESMDQASLSKELKWKAYGIHESFKRPEAPSRWYAAFASVCKAAESTLERNFSPYKRELERKNSSDESCGLIFVKPIIILDGMLFAASLTDTADLCIEEIKFASTEFAYKSKGCPKGTYYVDIVTLNNLSEYIVLSEKRLDDMLNATKSIRMDLQFNISSNPPLQ